MIFRLILLKSTQKYSNVIKIWAPVSEPSFQLWVNWSRSSGNGLLSDRFWSKVLYVYRTVVIGKKYEILRATLLRFQNVHCKKSSRFFWWFLLKSTQIAPELGSIFGEGVQLWVNWSRSSGNRLMSGLFCNKVLCMLGQEKNTGTTVQLLFVF